MTRGTNHKKPSAPYYTLDLHGYRKEDAIERLTRYFDQIRNPPVGSSANKHSTNEVFATVITGSGKHSHDGPVLRQAVQSTLTKRQMKFRSNKGNGSFTVDVFSGIDLYAAPLQRADTKIQIRSRPSDSVNLISRPPPSSELQGRSINLNDEIDINIQSSSLSSAIAYSSDPLPSEVANEEKIIQEIKNRSLEEASMRTSQLMRQDAELQKAMDLSLKREEDMERKIQFEQEQLEQVLEESKTFGEEAGRKEEMLLKQVLEESKQAEEQFRIEEERMIRKALEESKTYSTVASEESSIKEVIELSKRCMTLGDDVDHGNDTPCRGDAQSSGLSYEQQIEKVIQQSLYYS